MTRSFPGDGNTSLASRVCVLVAALMAMTSPAEAQRTVNVMADSTWLGYHRAVRDPMEPQENRRLPVVRAVFPCSPAHFAGLEPGDLLVTVNGQDARTPTAYQGPLGTEYEIVVDRAGERLNVKLVRARRPKATGEPVAIAPIGSLADWECPTITW